MNDKVAIITAAGLAWGRPAHGVCIPKATN